MRSNKAAVVLSVLMYGQALLGFAAVAAVLLKQPESASARKGSVSISSVETAPKSPRVAG